MSHPTNRRERFLKGQYKGEKRALGEMDHFTNKQNTNFEKWASHRRDTTKLCSCSMCGNPRRTAWKGKDKLTRQELKFKEKISLDF